tara:strand:- start:10198 stop:10461 length:264 start_codon:yes stop_codon:yes gene_type:complete
MNYINSAVSGEKKLTRKKHDDVPQDFIRLFWLIKPLLVFFPTRQKENFELCEPNFYASHPCYQSSAEAIFLLSFEAIKWIKMMPLIK